MALAGALRAPVSYLHLIEDDTEHHTMFTLRMEREG
jgi:hypothetical protein